MRALFPRRCLSSPRFADTSPRRRVGPPRLRASRPIFYTTSMQMTSITLVRVGPVINNRPRRLKKWYESFFMRYSRGFIPAWSASRQVFPPAKAPAASVGPSVPSVPALRMEMRGSPSMDMAAARASSWFRPPFPRPRMVTVVSPPARMHAGAGTGSPDWRISFPIAVIPSAISRASPWIKDVRTRVLNPSETAFSRAASSAARLLPTITFRTRRKNASPGLGGFFDQTVHAVIEDPENGGRDPEGQSIVIDDPHTVGKGAGIGDRGAGCDHVQRVPDDVGQKQRYDGRGLCRFCELAPLAERQVLSHGVDLTDGRSAVEQELGGLPYLIECNRRTRGHEQGAPASGECTQDQVFLRAFPQSVQDEPGSLQARIIGDGVPRFHDAHLFQKQPVMVFDDDPARGETVPENIFKGFCHGRRCFSDPHDQDPFEAVEIIRYPVDFQPIVDAPHAPFDGRFGLHGPQTRGEDFFEFLYCTFIHGKTSRCRPGLRPASGNCGAASFAAPAEGGRRSCTRSL